MSKELKSGESSFSRSKNISTIMDIVSPTDKNYPYYIIKEALSPYVENSIRETNEWLYEAGNDFVLVIGGGECFRYYFGKNPDSYVLTSDFDVKICIIDGFICKIFVTKCENHFT